MTNQLYSESMMHLITNPEQRAQTHGQVQDGAVRRSTLDRTRQYVFSVLKGDGKRPYCPYVPDIERGNGYYVIPYEKGPEQIDFSEIVKRLKEEFINLSSQPTQDGQPLDIVTVVAAFGHPDALSQAFCQKLEQFRNLNRLPFLEKGLMIAHMHPFHSLGSASERSTSVHDKPLYTASIPLLMVRRMHAPDHVFMHTPNELAAYARYFPATSNMVRQRNVALAKKFTGHPFFKTIQKPEFQQEKTLKTFMHIMLLLSRLTQECLRIRQASVQSGDFKTVFEAHAADEMGHDRELEADIQRMYGAVDEFTDETLIRIFNYFLEKMKHGTDPEKSLLSFNVLESAAAEFYKIVAPHITLDTRHFTQHLEKDNEHRGLGSALLENLSSAEYVNLMITQKEGFQKIDEFFTRVNDILSENA